MLWCRAGCRARRVHALVSRGLVSPGPADPTNTRDAIWSGACSSGGNKVKTCTFTIQGDASVTANVQ